MIAALLGFMAWTVAAFALGSLVGLCIRSADTVRTADAHTAPDGTAGDLLADAPFDCLSRDEQVKRLEAWL